MKELKMVVRKAISYAEKARSLLDEKLYSEKEKAGKDITELCASIGISRQCFYNKWHKKNGNDFSLKEIELINKFLEQ